MKKSIWIVLPIIIIAVVLVAVFAGQRNSLSDQIAQLQSDKATLSRQLTEADAAAQKKVEEATSAMNEKIQAAETLVQETQSKLEEAESKVQAAEAKITEAENKATAAEAKAQEAADALNTITTERDALQANTSNAAEQLTSSLEQTRSALETLVGPTDDELSQTKTALAAANEQISALEASAAETAAALSQSQQALAVVTGERDALKASLESTTAQIAQLQESLKVGQAGAIVTDAQGNVIAEYKDISELKLDEVKPGCVITVVVYSVTGEECARYQLPFGAASAE